MDSVLDVYSKMFKNKPYWWPYFHQDCDQMFRAWRGDLANS